MAIPAAAAGLLLLASCSSAPIRLRCEELEARVEHGDLSEDQLRFARQELEACREDLRRAQEKDSLILERAHERFTPEE